MKKAAKIGLWALAIFIVLAGVFAYGMIPKSKLHVYENELNLKYADPKVAMIPEEEKVESYEWIYEEFFNKESEEKVKNWCKDGKPAEEIVFFERESTWCPGWMTGCGNSSRIAYVCGDRYIIGDFSMAGPEYYGPFDLEQ